MTQENTDLTTTTAIPAASEPPAQPRKEKKEKKQKEKKTPPLDSVQLPVLVELTYSAAIVLLIFVGLAVIVVSVMTGASLLNLVLRTSAAILGMGGLLMVIFYQVSSGVLQASLVEQEEAQTSKMEEPQNPESPAMIEMQDTPEAS